MSKLHSQQHLETYIRDQSIAENMIPLVGELYRSRGIVIGVYGRKLMNASIVQIIRAHQVGKHMEGEAISMVETNAVLEHIRQMPLSPSRIDIGKLASQYSKISSQQSLTDFLNNELANLIEHGQSIKAVPQDVVLYGFGRIGRILARLLIERTTSSNSIRLRAVVVRGSKDGDLEKRASLLRRDSVHGPFNGSVVVDYENSAIIANGNYIQFIYANSPEEIDYTKYDIHDALIVDNTGVFRDHAELSRHLQSKGAKKVLLTAPANDVKNIVHGVNQEQIEDSDTIICAASCTTNAITPTLKVMHKKFGISNGHVETVHSYTNDQNLIDNYHKADRRGRSAPLNMVITSTGAAKAVVKALPELKGKLTGNAIRVPTPNVSMAVINLNLNTSTTRDEINDVIREIALDSDLSPQIAYSASTEVVSSDLVGTPEPAIFDSVATICEGNHCVLYIWYDNEYGYSTQVLRVMRDMVGMHIPTYPKPSLYI